MQTVFFIYYFAVCYFTALMMASDIGFLEIVKCLKARGEQTMRFSNFKIHFLNKTTQFRRL